MHFLIWSVLTLAVFAVGSGGISTSVASSGMAQKDADIESVIPGEFRLEDDTREAVADLALAQLDIQYRYGGVSWKTGYDCSGFVRWVLRRNGVSLPRTALSQAGAGV